MLKKGSHILFISLLFIAEDVLLLGVLFFVMLEMLQPAGAEEAYFIAATVFNLAYLLSIAVVEFEIDLRRLKMRDIVRRTVYRMFVTAGIVVVCMFPSGLVGQVSEWFLAALFGAALLALTLAHWVTRKALTFTFLRTSGKAIILGAGVIGRKVYAELKGDVYRGVSVLGIFDDGFDRFDRTAVLDDSDGELVFGTLAEAKRFARENGVTKVYCALPLSQREKIFDFLNFAEFNVMAFHIVPESAYYYDVNYAAVETLGNMPVFAIRNFPLYYHHNVVIKRAFDLAVSFIFLTTLFPVICLIAGIAIKLGSPGPVFFAQKRTGKLGRDFKCYKFRSMRCNSEADTRQAKKNDDRTTPVGKFLRKTNLDEIPQFINVFLGDMSVVGPRPHMLLHTEEYSRLVKKYMVRHFIKPGITGLAQINGFRGETKDVAQMEGRIKKDIEYLENWSLMFDMEIILKTIVLSVKGDEKAY
jgi:putative colanic acid biosynthesis UDP-glucose lipid carrier transferase